MSDINVKQIEQFFQQWHSFASSELFPKNLYTVSFHYIRHVADSIKQIGPLRVYSASMERMVGFYDRRIKSTQHAGTSAGNKMELMAAQQYYTRTIRECSDKNDSNEQSKKIVCFDSSGSGPELWGPHLKETTTDEYKRSYNLMHYLRNFWAHEKGISATSLPILKSNITIGQRLFLNGSTYECAELSKLKGYGTFLKISLPDYYTKKKSTSHSIGSDNSAEYKTYFGEAILFFTHRYMSMHIL
ncbi:hypothetical protein BDC45DRAFT_227298 [Circinella umbellata]|nr:hypothetical protein BDC45DRAFT_227298 [Circinella umbellata]